VKLGNQVKEKIIETKIQLSKGAGLFTFDREQGLFTLLFGSNKKEGASEFQALYECFRHHTTLTREYPEYDEYIRVVKGGLYKRAEVFLHGKAELENAMQKLQTHQSGCVDRLQNAG